MIQYVYCKNISHNFFIIFHFISNIRRRFFAERPYEFFYTINISMSHFMKNYKYFNS